MLNVMRENLRHLKWVLIVVAVAMVASLGFYFRPSTYSSRQGVNENWAARINGVGISDRMFLDAAANLDARYQAQLGDQYEQLRTSLRPGTTVIRQLVTREVMLQEARKLGLTATAAEIAESIRSHPELKGADGRFVGAEEYKNILNMRYPGGVPAFEALLAEDIILNKWTSIITAGAFVTDREAEDAYRKQNEKTAIEYVLLTAADQEVPLEVSDEEAAAWYESHQDDYMRDERRSFRYLVVDRQAQLEKVEIPEEDIQRYYEENQAAYSHPEQRKIRHILFRVEPDATDLDTRLIQKQAESVHRRIAGGEDFESLAKAMSQDPGSARQGGDLGWVGRGRMVPEFEEAAFNTAVGELAEVTRTDFGFHVIQTTDSREAGTTALDEVRESIRNTLSLRKAQELMLAEAERLKNAMTTPEDFVSVADAEGLQVSERTVAAGDRMNDLSPSPEFMESLFLMEPGTIAGAFTVAQGQALVLLDEIIPPSIASLEEAGNEVREAILNDRAMQAAVDAATRALDRNRKFSSVASALNKEVQESGDLAPGKVVLPGTGGSTPELVAALFSEDVATGSRGVVQVPSGALVYEVTNRVPFDAEAFAAARDELNEELLTARRRSLLDSILSKLWDKSEIEFNNPLIEQADS